MRITWEIVELRLRHPFGTSYGVSTSRRDVIVRVEDDEGRVGWGEAAPYYGETAERIAAELESRRGLQGRPLERGGEPEGRRARAALEAARLDIEAQIRGVTVCELFGGDPTSLLRTSLTLGQASPDELARKASEALGFGILKLKVGTPHDEEAVRAVREVHPTAVLRADANGAWTEQEAPAHIEMLARHGVMFIEQPLPPGDPGAYRRLRPKSALPVYADESIQGADDIALLEGGIDGIVVKVGKLGGLRPTLACIEAARAAGLGVMIGCMIESSAGITAAAHLASRCDHADLDGHLLIEGDPFDGVLLEGGALRLPARPGLGLRRRS